MFFFIKVHAIFSSCSLENWILDQGNCIGGIAVRVENSLFAYRTCERISNHYSKPLIHHDTVYHICDDRHMIVDIGNPRTTVNGKPYLISIIVETTYKQNNRLVS